jgi:hypothetical protein
MTDIKWPALPDALPAMEWQHNMYTADQLRAHSLAVAAAVREACIAACEAVEARQFDAFDGDYENGVESGADQCASAIRAINIGAE